jgi:hypothetical protein
MPNIESGCWKSPRNSFQVDSTPTVTNRETVSDYIVYTDSIFYEISFSRGILSFHIKNKKIRVQKKDFLFCFFDQK